MENICTLSQFLIFPFDLKNKKIKKFLFNQTLRSIVQTCKSSKDLISCTGSLVWAFKKFMNTFFTQ